MGYLSRCGQIATIVIVSHLLDDLNTQQQAAVKTTEGPILILAGAGSGKTRVLTYRAAWLIKEKGVEPHRLLLATFTNKAAGEMKDRIRKLLQEDDKQHFELPFAGTFHSFCAKFLRREGAILGIPANFVIYDEADQLDLIKEIFKEQAIDTKRISPSSILSAISSAKNELISTVEYPQYSRGTFAQTVALVYPLYQNRLKAAQALDFDDLLAETVRILKREEQIAQKYQFQFRYILVH
ncbi:MAG: UvrD-helicase domain-containing protein [Candidatus Levybacteria bacterium]|nr:UvrD-helicase domain-containing protein [Candidatus Levybacteria bacterium]